VGGVKSLSFNVLRLLKLVIITHVLPPLFLEFLRPLKMFSPTRGLAKLLMQEVSEEPCLAVLASAYFENCPLLDQQDQPSDLYSGDDYSVVLSDQSPAYPLPIRKLM
jgi:hypothetical protein